MRNRDYFRGKKVAVVGLARSGYACARLLHEGGADVTVTERNQNEHSLRLAAELSSLGIKVELGQHSREVIQRQDLIVVSPGVSLRSEVFLWAGESSIPVIGEIEAGWILCPATVVAVTGTNGKTTVTTLIGKALEAAGKKVFTCGNIGTPFCQEVPQMKEGDFVSLEVSSFQLETIASFKPKVAVLLNFSRNHLDRYKSVDDYLSAKKRIFMNQDARDHLVLNAEDPVVSLLKGESEAAVTYFRRHKGVNANQAAVLAVADIVGIPAHTCVKVFEDFKGIEHRLEFVALINDIEFINDSKSTTVESTLWALRTLSKPIILIAGGRDKGNDFTQLLSEARGKIKKTIALGESRETIKNQFKKISAVEEAHSLNDAVSKAFTNAQRGDLVLLSPMCSSFDMFRSFEERGRIFKEAVMSLNR